MRRPVRVGEKKKCVVYETTPCTYVLRCHAAAAFGLSTAVESGECRAARSLLGSIKASSPEVVRSAGSHWESRDVREVHVHTQIHAYNSVHSGTFYVARQAGSAGQNAARPVCELNAPVCDRRCWQFVSDQNSLFKIRGASEWIGQIHG